MTKKSVSSASSFDASSTMTYSSSSSSSSSSISTSTRPRGGCLRFLTGRYLTPTMCRNLLTYKYDGADLSLLYRYVLQPMNARLIEFVPRWMAPNLMTLLGLGLIMISYFTTQYYSPNCDQPMPSWVYLLCAASLFGYQTIDNLDGRQARRTGSSSPLGLLFDHGVDALNCTCAGMVLAAIYSCGQPSPYFLFAFWNMGYLPFVWATWEEYWTGKLTLGVVNGPSDGVALCMFFAIMAFCFPGIFLMTFDQFAPQYFSGTSIAKYTLNYFPIVVGYIGILFTIIGNIYQVSKKQSNVLKCMSTLLPFVMMSFFLTTWVYLYPTIFMAHFRVFLFSSGFLFCQMICSLMIDHVCHAHYSILRPVLIPLGIAWLHSILLPILLPHLFPLIPQSYVIYALALWHFSAWLHFITNTILEITELLNIECFRITPKDGFGDGATVDSMNAHLAAKKQLASSSSIIDSARHDGILPLSPNTSEQLYSSYAATLSASPPPITRTNSRTATRSTSSSKKKSTITRASSGSKKKKGSGSKKKE